MVVFDHAYHGRTMLTMAMTAKDMPYKHGFGPFPDHVHRAPYAYPLRWPTGPEHCAQEALAALEELLATIGPDTVAAVVVEPVQGEGGFVVPDLVCSAKALGGGLPLSAVTGRTELMDAVHPGGIGGTYAGNPLACAAALGVLDMLEDGELLGAARRIEQSVRDVLEPLAQEVGTIAEVRGRGAMLAIELVHPGTLEPAHEVAKAVAAACHAAGVIILVCGTYGNVIRLLPPLVIEQDLLQDALDVLAEAVRHAS